MILSDYHIHTLFSGDCNSSLQSVIDSSIQKGLKEICITDHQDFGFIADNVLFEIDSNKYFKDIDNLKEKHFDNLIIKTGIEIGLEPDKYESINNFISSNNFDFVIASSHLINGKDPYYPEFFEGKSDYQAFYEYFESIVTNLELFSDFDVYGHLDYVVRYSPNKSLNYSYNTFKDIIDKILIKLLDLNKGIELNTNGYRLGLNFPNPCIDILKRYKELGGDIITIGSDAHNPEDIAYNFDIAENILSDCGFKYYCTFLNRIPQFIKF